MSISKQIVCVSNLTEGGAVVYKNQFKQSLKGVTEISPRRYMENKNKILNILTYIKYLYFDLLVDYYRISSKINNNSQVKKVIVFQDSYLKSPYCLFFLTKKTIYILHEPPREFYEPSNLHAPTFKNKIFNIVFRKPIKYIDYFATRKASVIVSNSIFSQKIIENIYKKKSTVVYPGISNEYTNIKIDKTSKKNCISVGSLLGYKGHIKTINDISKITKKNRPELLIIGSGTNQEINYLKKTALDLEVKIKILSNLTNKQLINKYIKSKIYINNAVNEPFGLAALESLFCGCYLVTNNTGGTKELKKYFINKVLVSDDGGLNMPTIISKVLSSTSNIEKKHTNSEIFNWKKISARIIEL